MLGGKKLKLVVRDNKSDPAEATRVAKNLWGNERVQVREIAARGLRGAYLGNPGKEPAR